ncbi:SurA N-terminal domain-containing protein [bacterium]|nr:SurA N-terminal domain-containing protein [candidate division CSSED10-310 bacterium]
MLNTFRTKIKFWSHLFLWPVIISFIAFYGWSFLDRPTRSNTAATVGEVSISLQDVVEARRRLTQYYRDMYKDNFERIAANMDFNEMALDQLVNQALLNDAAETLGVKISKQEVQDNIRSIPAFQSNGSFSMATYSRTLSRVNMTPVEYEAAVAQDLKVQRTRQLIGASAPVTDFELKEQYIEQNVKIACDYFIFRMPDFKDEVIDAPEEIEKYYSDHQEEFRVGDQIMLDYIKFDPAAMEKSIEIDDADVEDYYDQHFDEYEEPEKVKARHILFKVDPDADESVVESTRLKAVDVIARIKNGEDFAKLAEELSDCPSAKQGGDLGFFTQGQMDRSFEQAAWDLEIDGMTEEPVRSQFGWHVIQKTGYEKQNWKTLDQVKAQIVQKLQSEEAKIQAMEEAQKLFDRVEPLITRLPELVENTDIKVETTEFFESAMPPRQIGFAQSLKDILVNLEETEISIPVETSTGVYLFQLKATRESFIPPFEDVKDSAAMKYRNWAATKKAEMKAASVKEYIDSGKTWAEAAEHFAITSENTGLFARGANVPKIGGSEEIVDELFGLETGIVSRVITIRSNAVLFRVSEKQEFSQEAYEKELPKLRQQVLNNRQNQVVSSWLDQYKKQLAQSGKFSINSLSELD